MTLSINQAADSLREIEKTGHRSASAYGYAKSSPHLILWGVIWFAGYLQTAIFVPAHLGHLIGPVWLGLDVLGFAGTAVIGYHQDRGQAADSEARLRGRRFAGSFAIIVLFILSSFAVIGHVSAVQQAAFWPLVVAMFYAIMGLWSGKRFLVTGLALTALTLVGFFWLRESFYYWMAVIGGGALVLAGLWFRKV
jgi:hypothetical protein